ncbi:MAG: hypothetical protein MSA06_09920 [Clostridiales bacterium]|nr:hypothetical protein [Clostridiales bacterium]
MDNANVGKAIRILPETPFQASPVFHFFHFSFERMVNLASAVSPRRAEGERLALV